MPLYHRFAVLAAAVFALIGSAGSLYLSVGLGLHACPLCFYQRSFVMATFAVLVVGWLADGGRVNLAVFALPTAVAGFVVALMHTRLVANGGLECPAGLFGWPAPVDSLAIHALLVAALGVGCLTGSDGERGDLVAVVVGVGLGVAIASGCLNSNPPGPTPKEAYQEPPVVCRKPYQGVSK